MRLTQLQYLMEIKKQGSISKAAQHLYIAQPSLSAAVRDLENELGYELMKRSKRGVTFTPLGEQVLEKAVVILREIEAIRCLDQVQTGHMSGRIFLSAVPFVCEHFILDLIVRLKTQHPDLHLILDENDGSAVLQRVQRREADLGIIMICSNEEQRFARALKKHELAFDEFYEDEIYFWVGKDNPFYGQKSAKMGELLQFPYVYYKDSFTEEDAALFSKHCARENLELVSMQDRDSVKKYVLYSQAVTIMPYRAAKDNIYFKTGLLHPLRLADEQWHCHVGLVYRKDIPLTREEIFLKKELCSLNTNQ